MAVVSKREIKEVLASFQKDKIPRLDGWAVEFFTSYNDLVSPDIMRVINEAKKGGHEKEYKISQ